MSDSKGTRVFAVAAGHRHMFSLPKGRSVAEIHAYMDERFGYGKWCWRSTSQPQKDPPWKALEEHR